MNKTVEILLAAYNGEKFLSQQIDSILAQSNDRWHLTISDDGSKDSTLAIIDAYVQKYPEKIEKHVSGRRFGNARDHFFHLMGCCNAQYMFFCDQDDVWYPDKVQKIMDTMREKEALYGEDMPLLVFSDQTPTDGLLHPLASSLMRYQRQFFDYFDYRSILMQNVVTGGAMCINRPLADLAAECMNAEQTIMHDWWLAVVAARFGKVIYIDEPLSDYRQHGDNSVGAKNVRSLSHIINKLSDPGAIRRTNKMKKIQAQVFAATYTSKLDQDDRAFLAGFVKERSGPLFYWRNRKLLHGFFRLTGMMVLG